MANVFKPGEALTEEENRLNRTGDVYIAPFRMANFVKAEGKIWKILTDANTAVTNAEMRVILMRMLVTVDGFIAKEGKEDDE